MLPVWQVKLSTFRKDFSVFVSVFIYISFSSCNKRQCSPMFLLIKSLRWMESSYLTRKDLKTQTQTPLNLNCFDLIVISRGRLRAATHRPFILQLPFESKSVQYLQIMRAVCRLKCSSFAAASWKGTAPHQETHPWVTHRSEDQKQGGTE